MSEPTITLRVADVEALFQAARQVEDSWESGDLAGAVTELLGVVDDLAQHSRRESGSAAVLLLAGMPAVVLAVVFVAQLAGALVGAA